MKKLIKDPNRRAMEAALDNPDAWFCMIGDHHPGRDFSGFEPALLSEIHSEQALRIISERGWRAENCRFWTDGHGNTLVTLNQEVV